MSKYILLMEEYKRVRHFDEKKAQHLFDELKRMVEDGEVTDKEIEGGAYI